MEAYFSYGPAYLYFFAPIGFAVLAIAIFAFYRAKRNRPMRPGRTVVSILAVANVLFMFINASLGGSPFGTTDSWLALWSFAFLPSSFIFGLVTEVWVGNLRDRAVRR